MFALVKLNVKVTDMDGNESINDQIKLFAPYTIWEDKDGVQHSPDTLLSLTPSQKQDFGVYDVAFGARGDDRFYTITENAPVFDSNEQVVKVTYTSIGKPLSDTGSGVNTVYGLKSQWIFTVKDIANKSLSQTDWMLVRKIERDIDVPSTVATYRAGVVAESSRLETAINAATTIEELITAVESASWPTAE